MYLIDSNLLSAIILDLTLASNRPHNPEAVERGEGDDRNVGQPTKKNFKALCVFFFRPSLGGSLL